MKVKLIPLAIRWFVFALATCAYFLAKGKSFTDGHLTERLYFTATGMLLGALPIVEWPKKTAHHPKTSGQ